ncbi:MAG TPA: hypothetical protein VEA99_18200 [Gemmatimonadaceae bacterium]|nr:hypothetical protein [Gemmatimonadaceae bacterium]
MRRPAAPSALVRLAAFTLAVAGAAACGPPKPIALGDDPGIAPQLALVDSERPPRTFTVTLAEPAHVAVLAVFPGRGATVLHPRDTTGTSVQLAAGTHQLSTDPLRMPVSVDSAILRPFERRPGLPDSAQARRDSLRAARAREQMRDPNARAMLGGPDRGHIMVFASRNPIDLTILRRRVPGVTIPLETREALRTVANMVRSATTPGRWAATAVETEMR